MTDMPGPPTGGASGASSAQSRYSTLTTFRRSYLERAWDCSELTIPSLLPREGRSAASKLNTPWQGMGARCVNNLSAKILMAAFPPNTPMFRLRIDEILLAKNQLSGDQKSSFDSGLSKIEKAVMAEIEMSGDRVGAFEALKHLIVAGNVLVFDSPKGLRVFHLSNYVVRRDPSGNPLEIITEEQIDPVILPAAFRSYVREQHKDKLHDDKPITLYTHVRRTDKNWTVYQEVCGERLPNSDGTYPLDECPWNPIRFTRIDGEDYGPSYVEEYMGDLRALEDLSQALVEGAKAAARLLILVNPNGTTRAKTLAEAANGAIVAGVKDEVGVVQLEKFHDFATAEKQTRVIEERLAYAFLLNSSIQRNAERVTLGEIRYMAQELETTLGGFYTILSQEFQQPYIRVKMARMQKAGRLPALPKGVVRPTIVTGIEALGRGNDRTKLVEYIRALSETLTPQGALELIKGPEFAKRLATADGIDTDGLIVTQDELDQQRQQQQVQAMTEKLGPQAIGSGADLLKAGAEQQAAQASPTQ